MGFAVWVEVRSRRHTPTAQVSQRAVGRVQIPDAVQHPGLLLTEHGSHGKKKGRDS